LQCLRERTITMWRSFLIKFIAVVSNKNQVSVWCVLETRWQLSVASGITSSSSYYYKKILLEMGLKQSKAAPCIFCKHKEQGQLIIILEDRVVVLLLESLVCFLSLGCSRWYVLFPTLPTNRSCARLPSCTCTTLSASRPLEELLQLGG
jgi:hypothetical protein